MSSLNILSFCEDITFRRRIEVWFIDTRKNFIRGNVRTFGINFERFIKGEILGFIPGIVVARIDGDVYALILGEIDKSQARRKEEFLEYLEQKAIEPIIII